MILRSDKPYFLNGSPDISLRWYDMFIVNKNGKDTLASLYSVYREDTREFIGFEFWPGIDDDGKALKHYVFCDTLKDFHELLLELSDFGYDLVSFCCKE